MSGNQEWKTPPKFLEAVQHRFGTITLDAAATENNVCDKYISPEQDGLKSVWFSDENRREVVWCNPGFSDMGKWVDKAVKETYRVQGHTASKIALLLGLASPSTKWWEHIIHSNCCNGVLLLAPRVQFVPVPGVKKSSNSRENALFVFANYGENLGAFNAEIFMWYWLEYWEKAFYPF